MEVIQTLSNGSVLSRRAPGEEPAKRTAAPRQRKTREELEQIAREALGRAESGNSIANYATILGEFSERGIPLDEIIPRENVFTYRAWQGKGRQVRRGEHGVKIDVWLPAGTVDAETGESDGGGYWRTATVFHVSQTDAVQS